jgi:hypothetical protein
MTRMMVLAGGALLLSTLAFERAGAANTKVELRNTQGESVGMATLEAMPDGVKNLAASCEAFTKTIPIAMVVCVTACTPALAPVSECTSL